MVGQLKLKETLFTLIQQNIFPRTLLLEGEYGCGKHLLVKELAEQLQLSIVDITEILTLDTIQNIYINPLPNIYLIDCNNISEKEQNVILKFLEEPLKNSYIILLTESKNRILPTVLNRCRSYSFEPYTAEELKEFTSKVNDSYQQYISFFTSPGMVLKFQEEPVNEIINLIQKIYFKISQANFSNILTIPNKINFNEKEQVAGMFSFKFFTYLLLQVANYLYLQGKISYNNFILTQNFYNDTLIPNINKKYLFEHFLFELKINSGI